MSRGAVIAVLIIVILSVVFMICGRWAGGAEEAHKVTLGRVVANQELILQKLDGIEQEMRVIKVRVSR